MSARLGYPLPSSTPAPDALCRGSVKNVDFGGNADFGDGDAACDESHAGTWLGRMHPNKYSGSIDAEGLGDEEAQRIANAAGLPYFTPARLAELAAELQGDPRLDELKAALATAHRDPGHAQSRSWQLSQALARDCGDGKNDVWAVLVLALRHALIDQGDQLRYTLDRLQMYAAMGQQMSKYGAVLQEAQRALDLKMSQEKDKTKMAFVEVPFNDQREYDAESFYALLKDGSLGYKQTARQPAEAPPAADLQAQEAEGYKPFWKLGFGTEQQHFKTPDGKKWRGRGNDEPTRRTDVIKQITEKSHKEADSANIVSLTGLGLKVQNYTQQREQLQKLTDRWQTRFQMDHEVKNQTAAAITSVLKNLHDMRTSVTRNLQ